MSVVTMETPKLHQTWKHRQFDRQFKVVEIVNADYTRIKATDDRGLAVKLHNAQLNEHYVPLD